MTTATIKHVGETRSWDGKYGASCAIPVIFADGSKAEYQTKPDSEAKRRAELEACIGKEGAFTLEDGGKFPDGKPKPLKLKDYPGKPKGQGQDGGGKSSWYNSEEGVRFTQERTDRRTALMQAVEWWQKEGTTSNSANIITLANNFYNWLRESAREPSKPAHGEESRPSPAPSPPPPATNGTAGSEPAGVREGPPQGQVSAFSREEAAETCPSCGSDNVTDKNPDGYAMPKGRWRCLACTKTWRVV